MPYFRYFRTVFTDLERLQTDAGTAKRIEIATRLLDALIAREESVPRLQQQMHANLRDLLPDSDAGTTIEESKDFASYLGSMQTDLILSTQPAAKSLARSIAALEQRYYSDFKAAVGDERAARSKVQIATEPGASAGHVFDRFKLQQFLRTALDEPELVISSTKFLAGGFSKWTLALALNNLVICPDQVILRSDSTAVHSAGSVINEFGLLCELYAQGIAVPKPLASEPSGAVFGAPFIIVARRPGGLLGSLLDVPPANPAVARDVATHLAKIHQMPLAKMAPVLPPATVSAALWVSALIDEDYRNWKALDVPSSIFEAAFAWLRRNVHLNETAPRTLMHGDYGMQNILVEDDRVSAILDWEFACIGHAAYDLGYFYDQAESMWSWDEFLQAYADAGAVIPDVAQLNYNILLTATRFGVMSVRLQKHVEGGGVIDEASAMVLGSVFIEEFSQRTARALARVLEAD